MENCNSLVLILNAVHVCVYRFQSQTSSLSWRKSKHSDTVNLECVLASADPYYIRVNRTEAVYKLKRHLPDEEFAHHTFHLYPPLVIHNLLPFDLYIVSL